MSDQNSAAPTDNTTETGSLRQSQGLSPTRSPMRGGALAALFADSARIEAERRRLVAYCTRMVGGDRNAADEIAQEALTLAWSERDRLRQAEAWQPWITGIARNLCLRRRQQGAIEARRRAVPVDSGGGASSEGTAYERLADPAATDPLAELERDERTRLLDRALSRLPRASHALLIERYVDDLSVAEIAARRGVREETAAVQLYRGRAALKNLLIAPDLRDDAVALGLVAGSEAYSGWTETRLWCPRCGSHRLRGWFDYDPPSDGETSPTKGMFGLRCPSCDPGDDWRRALILHSLNRRRHCGRILDGVKGYRAGMKRIARWWTEYADQAVSHATVSCHNCGVTIPVQNRIPADDAWASACRSSEMGIPVLFSRCPHCGQACTMDLNERAFMLADSQQFWSRHPRLRVQELCPITTVDGPAFVTRLEAVQERQALEVVTDARTLAIRSVLRTV